MAYKQVMTQYPNSKVVRLLGTDTTNWYKVVGFPDLDANLGGGRYGTATVRSVATGGTGDGSAFQFLLNQPSTPAAATKGKLISAAGQTETIPGGAYNMYVKLTAATDEIEVEVFW